MVIFIIVSNSYETYEGITQIQGELFIQDFIN